MFKPWTTLLACALLACLMQPTAWAADAPSADKADAASPSDEGWELVFHDTFNRDELGEHWQVMAGQWKLQEGQLRGSGALISARPYPVQEPTGFQRLVFEAHANIQALSLIPGSKPKVVASDMDAFIHAKPFEPGGDNTMMSGYFFQFGGNFNQINRIRHEKNIYWEEEEPKAVIDSEKWHRIMVENDQGTLRLFVDDKLIHEYKLTSIIMGTGQDRVGMYFMTGVKIRDVKVYVKQLPNDLDLE